MLEMKVLLITSSSVGAYHSSEQHRLSVALVIHLDLIAGIPAATRQFFNTALLHQVGQMACGRGFTDLSHLLILAGADALQKAVLTTV